MWHKCIQPIPCHADTHAHTHTLIGIPFLYSTRLTSLSQLSSALVSRSISGSLFLYISISTSISFICISPSTSLHLGIHLYLWLSVPSFLSVFPSFSCSIYLILYISLYLCPQFSTSIYISICPSLFLCLPFPPPALLFSLSLSLSLNWHIICSEHRKCFLC